MKKFKKVFLALSCMGVLLLAVHAQEKAKEVDKSKVTTTPPSITIVKPCDAPDLAASISSVRHYWNEAGAFVEITGMVKNVGGKNFISGPGQATAILQAKLSWGTGASSYTLQSLPFTRLNVGAYISLSGRYKYDGNFCGWGCAELHGGQCRDIEPVVKVEYDVHIREDGNLDNDDCRYTNNISTAKPADHVKFAAECTE